MNEENYVELLEQQAKDNREEIDYWKSNCMRATDQKNRLKKDFQKLNADNKKTVTHLRMARVKKKSYYEQLVEVTRKADDLHTKNIKLQEILEETRTNEIKLYDETEKLKEKVEALEKANEKWHEIYNEQLDKTVEYRNDAQDNLDRALASELENTELLKDVVKLVRMLPHK